MGSLSIKTLPGFFKDKNGKPAIMQRPNVLIILWAGLSVLSKVTDGRISNGISILATILLVCWAYLEITAGDSMFRRLLGVVVLSFSMYGIIN
jgi:hypothetical protein